MDFPNEIENLKIMGKAFHSLGPEARARHAMQSWILWHTLYKASKASRKEQHLKQTQEHDHQQFLNFIRSFAVP